MSGAKVTDATAVAGAVKPQATQVENLWTPANIVTLTRIVLVPVFVVLLLTPWTAWFPQGSGVQIAQPWIAALFFIVLAMTDSLDGYLARSRNEITTFGKFMDPLADKLLVCSALIALVELGILPAWVVIVIIARDFIMSGIRLIAATQAQVIAASWYGKFKTAFQMVAIVMFLVLESAPVVFGTTFGEAFRVAAWVVMGVALVLTVVSLVDYFYHARHLLGFTAKQGGEEATAEDEAEGARVGAEGESGEEAAHEGVTDASAGVALSSQTAVLSARAGELARGVIAEGAACGVTVATCESLTGGFIGAALTAVSGSSAVVRGGLITYATETKHDLAGVSAARLAETGPVDEEVAREMAAGTRAACKADVGVAVTGIAGPTGAEPGKPVGTVWLAVATDAGVYTERAQFAGTREEVRLQTVCRALELVHEHMSKVARARA